MTNSHPPDAPKRSLFHRLLDKFFALILPDWESGPPRLFPRHAAGWSAMIALASAALLTSPDRPSYPGVFVALSIMTYLYLLYAGLNRWSGDGWMAAWMLMPGASFVTSIVLANKTEGAIVVPVVGTTIMFSLTVALAEWLRQRSSADRG